MSALTARWQAFSPRERLLLGVAGGLALVLLLTVLVIRPLAGARADGIAAFAEAAETRAAVARAVGSGGQASAPNTGPLRNVVEETATGAGVVIDRYDFQGDGVDLTISDVDAPTLYAWLGELSAAHGVVVREASVRASGEEGLVTARLTLERLS